MNYYLGMFQLQKIHKLHLVNLESSHSKFEFKQLQVKCYLKSTWITGIFNIKFKDYIFPYTECNLIDENQLEKTLTIVVNILANQTLKHMMAI